MRCSGGGGGVEEEYLNALCFNWRSNSKSQARWNEVQPPHLPAASPSAAVSSVRPRSPELLFAAQGSYTHRAHTHRSPPGKTTLNTHIYNLMWVKIVLIIVHASFERNQNIHQQKRGKGGERVEKFASDPTHRNEAVFFGLSGGGFALGFFLFCFLRRFRNKPVYYDWLHRENIRHTAVIRARPSL